MKQKTYLYHIKKHRLKKTANIQVNIPTYNSYETTRRTIKILLKQQGIRFDILVIDGGTSDYEKLSKNFPQINYVLLDDNYGSAGAQRIGGELALKYGYEYVIFTDNDAILLDKYGLLKMKNKLDSDPKIVAIVPQHTESFNNCTQEGFFIDSWSFHYLFVKTKVFKKINFHNFYLFLYSDDLSLTLKLSSVHKILVCNSVKYYHYGFNPKSLQNFYNFFYLRGLLTIIFKEDNILFNTRLKLIIQFLYKIAQMTFHGLMLLDLSYAKTILLSFIAFLKLKKDFRNKIPQNKYILSEVDRSNIKSDDLKRYVNISSSRLNLLFPPKKCFIHSNYLNKDIYFKRVKNFKADVKLFN